MKQGFSPFIDEENRYLISDDALDLLDKLLQYDPDDRITASQALLHPYFNNINEIIQNQTNKHNNDINYNS